jgi:hypothetical protein
MNMRSGTAGISIKGAVLALLLQACNSSSDQEAVSGTSFIPDRYEEGDTLSLDARQAPGLSAWIDYHAISDTGLRLRGMPASGVVIHLDPLDTLAIPGKRFPDTLMAWSPNRARYLDIWSYNHIVDTMKNGRVRLTGGGPEQIVALGDQRSGLRHILMFNGTGQIAEAADWLDDQTFVICMMLVDEASGERTPQVMLFNLKDSVFTDFRYIRSIPADRLPHTPGGFTGQWLQGLGIETEQP